ncbi:phosphoadenosine phosphosulfate reductase family protein [Pseudomonas monteilii]|uniref:phosphoadenosine phosphosulfate reductase domain-containing protein n=1 Tax=Pseudomonas monteilii TaxID=76759 RepID=UPI001E5BCF8A|nr:phosphoadenosine phosphosulfate reductase family protein [Pseudomonas monteilii]MCE0931671.1 phosphoadenosine phosphosulfate reductase family protein [Pseudomonas monteilii]MCE1007501.1 phosphoadenosine phosphosulfate reductase family protein [Pseudomonas monteilii]WJN90169.1 phosphoadenosine phosphosulfate reductase family protein [Pseudomonas monteilii]WJO34781.1 phosphoadenosine phosphosulfate reductase family protein [Pseudomonas monteilii]WJR41126.1 phosphoadenosine phosphosulfate redu
MDIPENVEALVASGALFVANHSGGKDSQAQLIKLLEVIPATQIVVVHASLGPMEWPGALELAEQQASAADLPFLVAKAGKTLLEMVERRYATRPEVPSWPSASTRQCTSDLKRGPIQREVRAFAKANGFKVIVNCLGLRAEESPSRRKRAVFSKMGISNSVLTWYEWLPVHDMSTSEVFDTIRAAGQEPHYAYALGNDRLSCVFCLFGSKGDLRNGRRHRPELLQQYDAMEKHTGYTMHMSRIPLLELTA